MWVDKIAQQASDSLIVINDSKTPSGRVHIGCFRGVLIHDALYRELLAEEKPVIYTYGIDDYDPMDGLPADASPNLQQYMGFPLCNIPSPNESTATDLADYYISEFLGVFKELGVGAQVYRMRDVYRNGVFNETIDTILSNAHIIRDIYYSVSGAKRPDNWYPFQVICEHCGRIGTTQVSGYRDGLVDYYCNPNLVSWAEGCGHTGRISPFDGNGKLPWKLEWAAKWHEFQITIEGAGKDHCTKGGSRDVASLVLQRVFKERPPINVPYEFFLVGGAKMSSSKGLGASARDMANFLPPEVLRYLMIRTDAKRTVNFTTEFTYLVKLYNDFDRILGKLHTGNDSKEDRMMFNYSRITSSDSPYHPASFQLLTSLLQLPHIDAEKNILRRLNADGVETTKSDYQHLCTRLASAKYWLDNLASEEDKFEVQQSFPDCALTNSASQNAFLQLLADSLENTEWHEDDLQTEIFETARNIPLPQPKAFEAIYRVLLGKDKGPKAGALLSYLDKVFVINRLREVNFSVMDFISTVGIPIEDYENDIDKRINEMDDIVVVPELYMCLPKIDALDDIDQYKIGHGVAAIQYTHMGKRHTDRVLFMYFEGYDTLNEQAKCFISELELIVGKLFGQAIQETVGTLGKENIHIEIDVGKLELYRKNKNAGIQVQ